MVNYFQYAESNPAVFATESVSGAALRTARSLIGSGIIFYCWFPTHNTYVHCTCSTARSKTFFKDKNSRANGDLRHMNEACICMSNEIDHAAKL